MSAKIFTTVALLISFISGFSQQNEIVWLSDSIKDLRTQEEAPFSCQFIIYSNDHIEWVQGDVADSYLISSTEGALPAEGLGAVTYHISKEGLSGKVTVERINTGDILLTLDFSEGTQLGAYFEFKVSQR